jgi:hypothetical protein
MEEKRFLGDSPPVGFKEPLIDSYILRLYIKQKSRQQTLAPKIE